MTTSPFAHLTQGQWRQAIGPPIVAGIFLGVVPWLIVGWASSDYAGLAAGQVVRMWPTALFTTTSAIWLAFRVAPLTVPGGARFEQKVVWGLFAVTALGVGGHGWIACAVVCAAVFIISGIDGKAAASLTSRPHAIVAAAGCVLIPVVAGFLSSDASVALCLATVLALAWIIRLDAIVIANTCVAVVFAIVVSWLIHQSGPQSAGTQALVAVATAALGFSVLMARTTSRPVLRNVAMIVVLIVGTVGVDRALASLENTKNDSAKNPASGEAGPKTNREHLFGRALAPGEFNDEPWGWWIETGFFRMGAPSPKKSAGTTRILVQGASSTQGFGIERDEDVWTSVLERELNTREPSRRYEVVNAGLASTTSFTMLVNYREELGKYEHDILLLYVGDNDATYTRGPLTEREMFERMTASTTGVDADGASMRLRRIFASSPLYRYVQMGVTRFRNTPGLPKGAAARVPAVPLGDFAKNLDEFYGIAKSRGVTLVLVGEASRADLHTYLEVMKKFADENSLVYADANNAPSACSLTDEQFFKGQAHLSVEANVCLGRFIAQTMLGSNLATITGSVK